MRRLISVVPLIIVLLIGGCNIEGKIDRFEEKITNIETVTNPFIIEIKAEKTLTEIIVELTTIITETQTKREVEQTTHIKESTVSAKITDMVGIINNYRKESNINSLKISEELCEIAEIRAEEASVLWSHTRPNGTDISSLLIETNIDWNIVGENLAKCENASAKAVVDAWMQSETHRANLLNPRYKYCGIAEYYDGKIRYISIILTD